MFSSFVIVNMRALKHAVASLKEEKKQQIELSNLLA